MIHMGKLASIFNRAGQVWDIGEKKWFFQLVVADAPHGYVYKHDSKLFPEHTRLLVLCSGKARELFIMQIIDYDLEDCVHVCLAGDQLVVVPEYYFDYDGSYMSRLV